MKSPVFIDRIEKKYQMGVSEDGIASLWQELSSYLSRYKLDPVPDITSVGSVYFDNRDYDLLRYSLLINRNIHVRLRTYEWYGRPPEPISDYWLEVKVKEGERRKKKRFKLERGALRRFLNGGDVGEAVLSYNEENAPPEVIRSLYQETRETLVTLGLRPILLVTYKRVAFQNTTERLSLDWDIQYYPAGESIYSYPSWKYLHESPSGKAEKTFLELKYPGGDPPQWMDDLQHRYPMWERNYSKYVEGMGFLFQGPLRHHGEAESFLQIINGYMELTGSPLR